jgi:BirA family biotin operon repressor/biotin-[acetyl-CoA-carboxylase] ligase
LNRQKILSTLKTKWLGRELILLDEVDSTNLHAARLLKEGKLPNGTAVIADVQSAGRGRLNRQWYSKGCLCMTAALFMEQSGDTLGAITLTAGVAVVQALTSLTSHEFKLKYPNDIICKDKKVGGILCELKLSDKTVVLAGIGINVEQEIFPDEIAGTATSLALHGITVDKESLAAGILNELEKATEIFNAEGFSQIRPLWLDANCTLGKEVTVNAPSGQLQGKAIDLDESGALLVETDGGIERVTTGDVLLGNGS